MMKLRKRYVEQVERAQSASDLFESLQSAIELEHSTIPPYLTAVLSFKAGNNEIAALVRAITGQEMLHMCIVSNILIALGGHPVIDKPGFVPDYPGALPMHIGGPGFIVGIEGFSKALVKNIFMVIEEPENVIPVQRMLETSQDYSTIGAFYEALKKKLADLGDHAFKPALVTRQVVRGKWFPEDQLFPIVDVASAQRGIDIIVLQGEGTSTSPYDGNKELAHYYRFGEIEAGRRLVRKGDGGYAYAGAPIPYQDSDVYALQPNCKLADFAVGTQAHTRIKQFNTTYNSLLRSLHTCFNGAPDTLDTAIGLMYSLRLEAVALMQTPVAAGAALMVGPSYEYQAV
jgi:hypothetical protein